MQRQKEVDQHETSIQLFFPSLMNFASSRLRVRKTLMSRFQRAVNKSEIPKQKKNILKLTQIIGEIFINRKNETTLAKCDVQQKSTTITIR